MRQVTHALLTRPPLSQRKLQTEVIRFQCFVRLACVKHAASVHPEPGSNSLIKCCSIRSDNVLAIFPFTVFKGQFLRKKSLRIFSRLSHCSVIKVLLDRFSWWFISFSICDFSSFLLSLYRSNSDIISCLFRFVNNFFGFFYFFISQLLFSLTACFILSPVFWFVNYFFTFYFSFLYHTTAREKQLNNRRKWRYNPHYREVPPDHNHLFAINSWSHDVIAPASASTSKSYFTPLRINSIS